MSEQSSLPKLTSSAVLKATAATTAAVGMETNCLADRRRLCGARRPPQPKMYGWDIMLPLQRRLRHHGLTGQWSGGQD